LFGGYHVCYFRDLAFLRKKIIDDVDDNDDDDNDDGNN